MRTTIAILSYFHTDSSIDYVSQTHQAPNSGCSNKMLVFDGMSEKFGPVVETLACTNYLGLSKMLEGLTEFLTFSYGSLIWVYGLGLTGIPSQI